MTDVDLFFPDQEPEERSLLDKVNDALKANSTGDTITVQDIAEKIGVGTEELTLWASNNPDFQKGLEKFRGLQEDGTFDELENRFDAGVIAMLLLETKNKYKPKE